MNVGKWERPPEYRARLRGGLAALCCYLMPPREMCAAKFSVCCMQMHLPGYTVTECGMPHTIQKQ